jgi:DNA mismatch endonuclease (patch repair protein)
LPGSPDIVLPRYRVVIFVDGDYWHGRNWAQRRAKLSAGTNAKYWVEKIERNRARDQTVNATLRRLGWTVIRVWETDVQQSPARAAQRVSRRILVSACG